MFDMPFAVRMLLGLGAATLGAGALGYGVNYLATPMLARFYAGSGNKQGGGVGKLTTSGMVGIGTLAGTVVSGLMVLSSVLSGGGIPLMGMLALGAFGGTWYANRNASNPAVQALVAGAAPMIPQGSPMSAPQLAAGLTSTAFQAAGVPGGFAMPQAFQSGLAQYPSPGMPRT